MQRLFLSFIFCVTMLAWHAEAWSDLSSSHGRARLFQAETADGLWNAGLAITMEDGWKTYWRVPGESGVPPQFDWSRSLNLKEVAIGWPAPHRFTDAAGEAVGYKHEVVFPLRIEPRDPSQPVQLELTLFYALCKDICIPAEASLALSHSSDAEPEDADRQLLDRFAAQVPQGPSASLAPKVASLKLAPTAEPVLEVTLARPVPPDDIDIFVEGHPTAYFRKPQAEWPDRPSSLFRLRIDGLKDVKELHGAKLTLTLVLSRASLVQTLEVE
jgi:DsbC/DsbD-like thiol-disulfide interchange protein